MADDTTKETARTAGSGAPVDWRKVLGPEGWGAWILILVAGWIVAQFLWTPLSWPARILNTMVGVVAPTECTRYPRGSTELEWCAAAVGAFTVLGPLLVIVALFVFRKQVRHAITAAMAPIPQDFQYLVAPTVAVIVFTIGWAGVHFQTDYLVGLVSNRMFPLFIGLFTFATVQYGARLQAKTTGVFDRRDKFPLWSRFVVTFAVPLLLAISLTREARVQDPALKEQIIVVVAIVVGWFLLVPRMDKRGKGALSEAIEDAAAKRRARKEART